MSRKQSTKKVYHLTTAGEEVYRKMSDLGIPQANTKMISPDDESVISRYSLVETHGGGGYYDPIDRFPVRRAASAENYAGGL